jgi:DNA polymerase-3 subunit delta
MAQQYLIIGNDQFMREKEISGIRDKFLSGSESDLNFSVHEPDDPDGIMDSLGTMPFLAERRVVLVKEAQSMNASTGETIAAYLDNPSDNNILVLSATSDLKKTKLYKNIKDKLEVITADKPEASTLKGWIRSFFRKEGADIAPGAVDLLVELKGDDTTGVRTELEKLIAFSGGETIEARHVEELVGSSVTEVIYKLVDAVNSGNAGWAWRIVNSLYDQKKRPHELIGYLGSYIRKIQKAKLLKARGADVSAVASGIGTRSTYYAKRMIRESAGFSPARMEKWITDLYEADRDIKTGRKKDTLAVEMLISGLLRKKNGRTNRVTTS